MDPSIIHIDYTVTYLIKNTGLRIYGMHTDIPHYPLLLSPFFLSSRCPLSLSPQVHLPRDAHRHH